MSNKYFPIQTATSCQLKWTWSTVFLYNGETSSCHRAGHSKLNLEQFDDFHNTPLKISDRTKMLDGQWPGGGCEYCKDIEDAGGSSDRMMHTAIPNLVPTELETDPSATRVTPKLLEIYLNNTCNLSCVYCSGLYSSKLNSENIKFNESTDSINISNFPTFNIISGEHQSKYALAFWQWMSKNSASLSRIHVLGGEPFYQKEFDDLLTYFENNAHPQLEFNIVSNLMISLPKLTSYVNRIKKLIATKKIRRLDITCSIDCWGKEQEFVRYGIDLVKWETNFNYLLSQSWIVLNINQTISPLTIKTMPELLRKLKEWKKTRAVGHYFSEVAPGPLYLKPTIFGNEIFKEDFEMIVSLMNDTTHREQEAKKYMKGIQSHVLSSSVNTQEIENLKLFLNEIDRRRNTNWKELFPWIQ